MKQPGTLGGRGGGSHVAGVGSGVRDASTEHGVSQQVLINLPAVLWGDELDVCAHELCWKGHIRASGGAPAINSARGLGRVVGHSGKAG